MPPTYTCICFKETSYKRRRESLNNAREDWVAKRGSQRCDEKSGRPRLARMAIDCKPPNSISERQASKKATTPRSRARVIIEPRASGRPIGELTSQSKEEREAFRRHQRGQIEPHRQRRKRAEADVEDLTSFSNKYPNEHKTGETMFT